MSDEKGDNLTHGLNIHAGEHAHALQYMATHMSEKQVKEMKDRLDAGHSSASFKYKHEGREHDYKMVKYDGHYRIERDH